MKPNYDKMLIEKGIIKTSFKMIGQLWSTKGFDSKVAAVLLCCLYPIHLFDLYHTKRDIERRSFNC